MTAGELIKLLQQYPPELEIFMEVNGREGIPTDIDWCSGGISSWLIITDYPILTEKKADGA